MHSGGNGASAAFAAVPRPKIDVRPHRSPRDAESREAAIAGARKYRNLSALRVHMSSLQELARVSERLEQGRNQPRSGRDAFVHVA